MEYKINKKAQHEIVGFVLIVVIVTIIGLVFLGFSIDRNGGNKQKSIEISHLLGASMYSTTNCATSFIPQYKNIQELTISCYRNEKCLNDKMACEVLEEDMKGLINTGFIVDLKEGGNIKGYELNIYYKDVDLEAENDEILSFVEGVFGNCSSKSSAVHPIYMSSGIVNSGLINIELEVCKN